MKSFKTSFLVLATGLTLTTTSLIAQSRVEVYGSGSDAVIYNGGNGSNGGSDKLSSAKIGFITSELELTPKQAEGFWPLYNEFDAKRKTVRNQLKNMRLEDDSMDDKQSLDKARNFLNLRESEVKLEREYFDKFSKVLNGKQVLTVMSMDREFARMLLKKTKDKFGPGFGGYHYNYQYTPLAPAMPALPAVPGAPAAPSASSGSLEQLNRELEQLKRQEKQLKKRIDKAEQRRDRGRERGDRGRERDREDD